jgi:hypothetical protein
MSDAAPRVPLVRSQSGQGLVKTGDDMRKLCLVTGIVCCSFLLAACSQDSEPQSSGASVASTENVDSSERNENASNSDQLVGVFVGEVNGGVVEVTVPFEDSLTEEIADYAQIVGFKDPLIFVSQTVSNQTDSEMTGCSPRLVTSDGNTIEFKAAFIFIGELQDLVPSDDVEMYNQGVNLYNSLLGRDALPGAKVTATYVAVGEPVDSGSVFSGAYTMETLLQGCDTKLVIR